MLVGDLLRRNVIHFGAEQAVVVPDGRTWTWNELADDVDRTARAWHRLGLAPGDRVAMLAPNCGEYLVYFFACATSGFVGAPLNVRLTASDLAAYLRIVEPAALTVHASQATLAASVLEQVSVPHVIGFGGAHPFPLNGRELLDAESPEPFEAELNPDAPYMLGATSGTTGNAKATVLTHANAVAAIGSWMAEFPVPECGTNLQNIPLFFNPGGPAGLHPVLAKGGRTVVAPSFEPASFCALAARYRPTHTILVPTMVRMVLDHPDAAGTDFTSLLGVTSGGSPLSRELLLDARAAFGDVFFPLYGMAETYSCGLILRREDQLLDGSERSNRRLGSAGKPTVYNRIRVVDEAGLDVAHDGEAVGEVILTGGTVSPGYFRMPEETAASRLGRWFRSGDLATVDDEGFVTIVDRAKDIIITGGINVASREVEEAVARHPAVAGCAAIGLPHPTWGETVHVVVVPRPGATVDEAAILAFAEANLARYKRPRSASLAESLPISATGKVLKRELRAQLAP